LPERTPRAEVLRLDPAQLLLEHAATVDPNQPMLFNEAEVLAAITAVQAAFQLDSIR
jgi:hypothetical protein